MYLKSKSYFKSDILKSFFRENSVNLFINSSFCFKNSYISEKFFSLYNFYNIYSRFSNPSLKMLEKKISYFEKIKYCLSFSSGMSAIFSLFINFIKPFNYFLTTINLFGSTLNFFLNFLFKFNIFVIFNNFFNLNFIYKNIYYLKIFFFESFSNPLLKIFDFFIYSYISYKYNIYFFLDNTFSTPILQSFSFYKIDFIIQSCTKFLEGQGRVLGGVILTNNYFLLLDVFSFLRFAGFNLSVLDSWIIFKSLDHLFLRFKTQINNSFLFLKFFKYNLFLFLVFYPGLLNYHQYKIFNFQYIFFNSLFSFVIKGYTFEIQRINSWKLIDNIFLSNTSNFGDVLSIITNCSTTTHNFLNFIEKIILFIFDSLIRISFGLEDIFDIYNNLILTFNFI